MTFIVDDGATGFGQAYRLKPSLRSKGIWRYFDKLANQMVLQHFPSVKRLGVMTTQRQLYLSSLKKRNNITYIMDRVIILKEKSF